jgi:hypothetical protein
MEMQIIQYFRERGLEPIKGDIDFFNRLFEYHLKEKLEELEKQNKDRHHYLNRS